jgi:SH3-like domain-containing protein
MKQTLLMMLAFVFLLAAGGTANALCVSAPEANLRSGPGTNYEKTWEVFKYMPLKRVSKKGLWYKVRDVDGDIYWVYGPLITSKYKCAVVKDDKANVRTGPATTYKQTKISPALKYYSFKVLKIKGQWVNVMDEYGEKGWIYKPLLWIQ